MKVESKKLSNLETIQVIAMRYLFNFYSCIYLLSLMYCKCNLKC